MYSAVKNGRHLHCSADRLDTANEPAWNDEEMKRLIVGALGTGAAYEVHNKSQMDQLDDDYRSERISRREYEARKKQIEAGSVIY